MTRLFEPLTKFDYLLNAMVAASHEDNPANAGYGPKRQAVLDYVRELERDAARYRWLRAQNWSDASLCVVVNPKSAVKLGHDCPSLARLDEAIDAAAGVPVGQEALRLVNKQAEDDGLWFMAQTASEAYLQAALRELHAAVERAAGVMASKPWRCSCGILNNPPQLEKCCICGAPRESDLPPTADDLRSWANSPASSGYVPVHPATLRALAAILDGVALGARGNNAAQHEVEAKPGPSAPATRGAAGPALSSEHRALMRLAAADLESWMKSYHSDASTEDVVKRLREAAAGANGPDGGGRG